MLAADTRSKGCSVLSVRILSGICIFSPCWKLCPCFEDDPEVCLAPGKGLLEALSAVPWLISMVGFLWIQGMSRAAARAALSEGCSILWWSRKEGISFQGKHTRMFPWGAPKCPPALLGRAKIAKSPAPLPTVLQGEGAWDLGPFPSLVLPEMSWLTLSHKYLMDQEQNLTGRADSQFFPFSWF